MPQYKKAKTILFYRSFNNEVETDVMIMNAIDEDKRVMLPKMINNQIFSVPINKETTYEKNRFGILEPESNISKPKQDIDLVVIPSIAIDLFGSRIGYGNGCYDRFLKGFKGVKVGLAYDSQIAKEIPAESHDIKVDYAITEKRIIKYGENKAV